MLSAQRFKMGDIDELKKLSPEERVEKLKEIEEKNKKEIDEARKLMTDSMRELEAEEEKKRDIPIPQLTSVDIDTLFGAEEKEMFKTKRFVSKEPEGAREKSAEESQLEESVQKENPKELPPDVVKQYTQQLEQMSNRLDEFKHMDEERVKRYKNEYEEELSQMYDNVKQMQHYAGVGEQIEKMNLTEQIGEIGSMMGYKRGGV